MEMLVTLFIAGLSLLVGVIVTLVVQYYILYAYLQKSPLGKPPQRPTSLDYQLPESLRKQIESTNEKGTNSSVAVSLILQFLFHELRHSESIKSWLFKKLTMEFEELLTKTTTGKFFEAINIKDMNLGTHFPDIKEITVEEVKMDPDDGHIDLISVGLDLDYSGSFLLSVDAKMKFGKTAYLSITVRKISGRARLQFTRHPYTHWSFTFYTDPVIELGVESHFQGRQLQSNITNVIVNQIKKAIKRKHTLPNYKIRYKPFFTKTDPSQLDLDDSEIIPQGQLGVTCVEVSRLELTQDIQNVYCTLSIDTIPWICVYRKDEKTYMILEITITKLRQSQIGVIFKQDQNTVVVESVSPQSSASRSGLQPSDIILSVENKTVTNVPQAAKLIKAISSTTISLRVERAVPHITHHQPDAPEIPKLAEHDYDIQNTEQDGFLMVEPVRKPDKTKTPEKSLKIMTTNENVSKFAQTLGNFALRKRKSSVSERNSSENSARNTPNSSVPGTPQHGFKVAPVAPSSGFSANKKHSISEVPEIAVNLDEGAARIEVKKGKEKALASIVCFNDEFQFGLKGGLKYLNVNVWGNANGKDVLLGYANVPLSHILNECCGSVLGHYMRRYSFLPPALGQPASQTHPLMSHSGFEHVFCYGDVLLSIIWTHEEDIELKRKMSIVSTPDTEPKPNQSGNTTNKHDFIRTQFHRTTHCDFCSKKIWLKDAVQCRQCGMCCHKKCIAKCQMATGCNPGEPTQPEITTEPCDDIYTNEETYLNEDSLKRVNSANNLSIPGAQQSSGISRSLPPSPQRTPSRKQSLVNINPFALCPNVLEEVQKQSENSSEFINALLEQVRLCPADEELMDAAKESGKRLYANMAHEERVEKINVMMSELKKTLDLVTLEHMELSKLLHAEESESEKTKLAFQIGQADAKVHSLSVLMLHYCSSLQQSQEKIV